MPSLCPSERSDKSSALLTTAQLVSFDEGIVGRGQGRSEENEDLLDVAFDVLDLLADDVEAHSLGEGTALADGDDITGFDAEGGRAVSRDGVVALLEPVVLLDVVQVVATDDDGPGHFSGDHNAPNQSTSAIV